MVWLTGTVLSLTQWNNQVINLWTILQMILSVKSAYLHKAELMVFSSHPVDSVQQAIEKNYL